LGCVIFNGANILFSATIAIEGIAVAFPVVSFLALALAKLTNYFGAEKGYPTLLF
jgi:glucose uptake protein